MNPTLIHLNARRAWFISSVSIWGTFGAELIESVATEVDDTQTRVVYTGFLVGGQAQEIAFASLIDHRGNNLPTTIDAPVVILIPRNDIPVAVMGTPSPTSFRLAKTVFEPDDGLVDLWIIEARS